MISLFRSIADQCPDLTHLSNLLPDDAPAALVGVPLVHPVSSLSVSAHKGGGGRVLEAAALDPANPMADALIRRAERHG